MKDLCVEVLTYNRPEFLYVTLDSLFRNKRIQEVDVNVYIDGGSDKLSEVLAVIGEFDVKRIYKHKGNLGTFWSVLFALKDCFETFGYSKCLYVEDDHILRTDAIPFCLDAFIENEMMSICGCGDPAMGYRSRGVLIPSYTFHFLYGWILSFEWVGTIRQGVNPLNAHPISVNDRSHDTVFYSYFTMNGKLMDYAQEYYTCHFGVRGVNSVDNDFAKDVYARMFSGDKTTWMDNIVKIIKNHEYDDSLKSYFFPNDLFKYE